MTLTVLTLTLPPSLTHGALRVIPPDKKVCRGGGYGMVRPSTHGRGWGQWGGALGTACGHHGERSATCHVDLIRSAPYAGAVFSTCASLFGEREYSQNNNDENDKLISFGLRRGATRFSKANSTALSIESEEMDEAAQAAASDCEACSRPGRRLAHICAKARARVDRSRPPPATTRTSRATEPRLLLGCSGDHRLSQEASTSAACLPWRVLISVKTSKSEHL